MASTNAASELFGDGTHRLAPHTEIQQFFKGNLDLLNSGKHSDITIRCENVEWRAHRFILCERSSYFAAAMERDFQETQTGVITFEEAHPDAVERLLVYLYTLDYHGGKKSSVAASLLVTPSSSSLPADSSAAADQKPKEEADSLVLHARVYGLAERLNVVELKELADQKFAAVFKSQPWPPGDFVAATLEVISSTPASDQGLRATVSELCAQYFREAAASAGETQVQGLGLESWRKVIEEEVDFTFNIMVRLVKKHEKDLGAFKDAMQMVLSFIDEAKPCPACWRNEKPCCRPLMGAHPPLDLAVSCRDCGYYFSVFGDEWVDEDEGGEHGRP